MWVLEGPWGPSIRLRVTEDGFRLVVTYIFVVWWRRWGDPERPLWGHWVVFALLNIKFGITLSSRTSSHATSKSPKSEISTIRLLYAYYTPRQISLYGYYMGTIWVLYGYYMVWAILYTPCPFLLYAYYTPTIWVPVSFMFAWVQMSLVICFALRPS